MEWYLKVLKEFSNFNGRARRKEYWMFVLFNAIIGFVISIIDNLFGLSYGALDSNGIIGSVYQLFIFIPTVAVMTRRLHDVNKSGWILLIFYSTIIIIVGFAFFLAGNTAFGSPTSLGMPFIILLVVMIGIGIYIFVMSVIEGDKGPNKYGPDPKGTDELQIEDHLV